MVPARISRLVIVGILGQLMILILLMAAVHLDSGDTEVQVTYGQNARPLITFAAPRGGRWVACQTPEKLCFQVY